MQVMALHEFVKALHEFVKALHEFHTHPFDDSMRHGRQVFDRHTAAVSAHVSW